MRNTTDRRPGGRRLRPAHPIRAAALLAALAFWGLAALPVLPAAAQEAEEPPPQVEAPEPPAAAGNEPARNEPADDEAAEDEAAVAAEAEPAAEASPLAASIADRYDATWSDDGVELTPRGEVAPGVRVVEVTEGTVRVNGDAVPSSVLRSWFGAEAAAPLLELAELDADEARQLLAVSEPVADEDADEADEGDEGDEGDEAEVDAADEAERRDEPRRDTGSIVKFGSDVVVEEDEVAYEAVSLGGDVVVYGRVRRDVVAVGGDVQVFGEVGGNVTASPGSVELGPNSEVDGDVLAVGGRVRRASGAQVRGKIEDVSAGGIGGGEILDELIRHDRSSPYRSWKVVDVYWNMVGIALMMLLVCLTYLVGRRTVDAAVARLDAPMEVLIAFLVGLAAWLLVVPVSVIAIVLVAITIVGCLLLPLLLIAEVAIVVIVFLLGYTAAALWVGRWITRRFGSRVGGPYVLLVIGLLAIEIWHLVGTGFDVFGGPMQFFAFMFILFGTAVEFLAMTIGIGAVILHLFDERRRRQALPEGAPPSPALPPGDAGDDGLGATPPADVPAPPPADPPPDDDFFDDGGEAAGDGDGVADAADADTADGTDEEKDGEASS
ncbi:MAG TPA: hypothetical protein VKU40_09425 [Thermoanaerobaculia bacterium]|nr:hypothetical protein [Thermoanaerobaculia bacterium]